MSGKKKKLNLFRRDTGKDTPPTGEEQPVESTPVSSESVDMIKPTIEIVEPDPVEPEPTPDQIEAANVGGPKMVDRIPELFDGAPKQTYVVTRPSALYVRQGPSKDARILYAAPKGTRFLKVSEEGDWTRVRSVEHPTSEAYVMSIYIEEERA